MEWDEFLGYAQVIGVAVFACLCVLFWMAVREGLRNRKDDRERHDGY